jgi:SAM-dependent methyltransferase
MQTSLDKSYWQSRYINAQTGWDVGAATPPLSEYIRQLENKEIDILIPGCGHAWEADVLLEQGFHNLTLLDVAEEPLETAQNRFSAKGFTEPLSIVGDFFALELSFDLVLEQTFFCALQPTLRQAYVDKMWEILKPGGKLAGLVFSVEFPFDGPPFGAVPHEYEKLFAGKFELLTFSPAHNSIAPRKGNEHFLIARKLA